MENKIDKELLEIAPTLAKMEKVNPFGVPEGYFSSLENRTLDALGKKPILDNAIPEGYFESLSDKVLERANTKEETKIIPLFNPKWLAIAASFIVLLGTGYLLSTQPNDIEASTEFAFDFEPEEALEYLIENDNLYLTDLLDLDIYEEEYTEEASDFESIEDDEIDAFLNELDQEDLEELL